ncbi:hypothetical protein SADUNF_Sadunf01G0038100 [Salix dunnii]|uniref:Uncharacterized protein n=1 Tax=Salix dunnii TaxID=1413687 RepID=A0A835TJW6_9ROSI|nr:hypothetical protein SADUNF_Sadunf01G0038100 [Salix dunnii]
MGGLFFSYRVLSHMYPFVKGLLGRRGRVPTIVYVWSGLVSITVSLLWISNFQSLVKIVENLRYNDQQQELRCIS